MHNDKDGKGGVRQQKNRSESEKNILENVWLWNPKMQNFYEDILKIHFCLFSFPLFRRVGIQTGWIEHIRIEIFLNNFAIF